MMRLEERRIWVTRYLARPAREKQCADANTDTPATATFCASTGAHSSHPAAQAPGQSKAVLAQMKAATSQPSVTPAQPKAACKAEIWLRIEAPKGAIGNTP